MLQLPTAEIEWRTGLPVSKKFGDIYFQIEDGLAESRHVFLDANNLRERLLDTNGDSDTLVIAETGFGSGLNFIACYALWKSLPFPKKRIEFVSIEAFPLSKDDLIRVAESFSELSEPYAQLVEQYPEPIKGAHQLRFEHDHIRLRLLFDRLETVIEDCQLCADVWFLDGFSPKANDSMWTDQLFQYIGSNAKPNTSLSTFTAAGFIKRGLQAAGFEITKIPGFGRKREMITARHKPIQGTNASKFATPAQPWHLPKPEKRNSAKSGSKVIVVGAGIAGLVQTLTLQRQGFEVTLLDKGNKPLSGASSQPQLIMYAKYPKQINPEGKLLVHAHTAAQHYYKHEQTFSKETFWHPIGLAQLAWHNAEQQKQDAFIKNYGLPKKHVQNLSAAELSALSGLKLHSTGLYFGTSGWLDTRAFADYVLNQEGVEFLSGLEVNSIKQTDNQSWQLETNKDSLTANNVILCAAYGVRRLLPEVELPLKLLRGQTTEITNEDLDPLSCVLCGEGYLSPGSPGRKELHLGATYDLNNSDAHYREEDNLKNLAQLEKWLVDSSNLITKSTITGGEAGLRTTSSDYTPIAGPVPEVPAMKERLAELKHNAKGCKTSYGSYMQGLYVNAGYGSKGLTFAPICADLITAHIKATPIAETHTMQKMLSPSRFLVRKLKKGLV